MELTPSGVGALPSADAIANAIAKQTARNGGFNCWAWRSPSARVGGGSADRVFATAVWSAG